MKKSRFSWKRSLAIILASLMVVAAIQPSSALADEFRGTETEEINQAENESTVAGYSDLETTDPVSGGQKNSDQDISNQENSGNKISDEEISDEEISDKEISDEVISDEVTSDEVISDEVTSDEMISEGEFSETEIPETEISEEAETVSYTSADGLTWTIDNNELIITGTGTMSDYTADTMPWVDYKTTVTMLIIGEGVANIGAYAFSGFSKIKIVVLGSDVDEIEMFAFQDCTAIQTIRVPKSVEIIGYGAFSGCTALRMVEIGQNVTYILTHAFYRDTALEEIVLPDSVTYLGDGAFQGCTSLASITFGDGITDISSNCCLGCTSLTSITYGSQVKTIGDGAFCGCTSLTEVNIPNTVTTIEAHAFFEDTAVTSINTGNGVTTIGTRAFDRCYKNKTITLGTSLTTIGSYAFLTNYGVEELEIPFSVTTIEEGAFAYCTSLKYVVIGNRVKTIGYDAFGLCSNLTTILFQGDAPTIDDDAFMYTPSSGSANAFYLSGKTTWTEDVMQDYGGHLTWKSYRRMRIVTEPEDTTVIEGDKFSFRVYASGNNLQYLWQYSDDDGKTWIDTTRTVDNYSTTAKMAMNGRMFRCSITDEAYGVYYTSAATLTVQPAIVITAQPVDTTVNLGEKFTFKVTAKSNSGSTLSYLWQYSKTLKGWTDTTRTLNNYGTYATLGVDGKYFRCKITDEAGNVRYSEPAMVRVLSDITITEQPSNTTVANGKRFYFTVTATGSSLTYLWQYSKDGGKTWTDTTRTKNNYTTYAKTAMNGWKYRCVITDSSNSIVTTKVGTLTVK